MIALIIIGAIILLLAILLFLPVKIDLAYDKHFVLKIKYSGITVFNNQKKPKQKKTRKKPAKQTAEKKNKATKKKDNFIVSTYKQKGLLGTIDYFSKILALVFKKLWWLVKRFKFRKFKLNLTVATNDAANTAIKYGKVCAACYPTLSLLQTFADFKAKEINISADFDKKESDFKISFIVSTRLVCLITVTISAIAQYLKLQRKESENNE